MESSCEHNAIQPRAQGMIPLPENRREALRLWLAAKKITLVELGVFLAPFAPFQKPMTGAGVSALLGKDRMQIKYHAPLVEYGIPEELLPRAEDVISGPKPKYAQDGESHA